MSKIYKYYGNLEQIRMTKSIGLLYVQIIQQMWPETRRYERQTIFGVITITNAGIGINRETKDLELRVAGEVQQGKDAPKREEYKISFPLWNYTPTLKEKGICKEVYDEVMAEERELLFAKYIKTWATLLDEETEQITSRQFQRQMAQGIKDYSALEELRNYQTEIYITLLMRQAERERMNRTQADEIQIRLAGALAREEHPEA